MKIGVLGVFGAIILVLAVCTQFINAGPVHDAMKIIDIILMIIFLLLFGKLETE